MYHARSQYDGDRGAMQPLVMEEAQKMRSAFVPGHRIKMNIVPMFVGIFLPWGVFILGSPF